MTETATETRDLARALAQEMRDAATKLREAAAQCVDVTDWYSADDFAQSLCGADTTWMALMRPALAEPLAAWLEGAAEGWRWAHSLADADTHPAVLTARAINGKAA